jgi:hypothetical protein
MQNMGLEHDPDDAGDSFISHLIFLLFSYSKLLAGFCLLSISSGGNQPHIPFAPFGLVCTPGSISAILSLVGLPAKKSHDLRTGEQAKLSGEILLALYI